MYNLTTCAVVRGLLFSLRSRSSLTVRTTFVSRTVVFDKCATKLWLTACEHYGHRQVIAVLLHAKVDTFWSSSLLPAHPRGTMMSLGL